MSVGFMPHLAEGYQEKKAPDEKHHLEPRGQLGVAKIALTPTHGYLKHPIYANIKQRIKQQSVSLGMTQQLIRHIDRDTSNSRH